MIKLKQKIKNFCDYIKKYKDKNDYYIPQRKNLLSKISQCRLYEKFEKQFSDIIEKGVDDIQSEESNKIWILWLQGEENAPEIVKA